MNKGLGLVAYVLKRCIAEMDQAKKTQAKPDQDVDMENEDDGNDKEADSGSKL